MRRRPLFITLSPGERVMKRGRSQQAKMRILTRLSIVRSADASQKFKNVPPLARRASEVDVEPRWRVGLRSQLDALPEAASQCLASPLANRVVTEAEARQALQPRRSSQGQRPVVADGVVLQTQPAQPGESRRLCQGRRAGVADGVPVEAQAGQASEVRR